MAYVIEKLHDGYKYFFYELKDERSADFFLLENPPIRMSILLLGYVLLVKWGPKLMKDREPFELKYIMMFYNIVQVLINGIVSMVAIYEVLIIGDYNYECEPCDYTTSRKGMLLLKLTYWYFLLKVLDLFDTLFIVLRKKDSHLSFLHCYHHFCMCLGTYVATRWIPGGHSTMLGIINSIVHAFMYTYYFLTSVDSEFKKSVTWKKRITQIQLIQFAFLFIHYLRGATAKDCSYPKFWSWTMVIQNVFMLSLFGDFYWKAYIKKKQK